jgi:hypothetical protein
VAFDPTGMDSSVELSEELSSVELYIYKYANDTSETIKMERTGINSVSVGKFSQIIFRICTLVKEKYGREWRQR